MYSFAYFLFFFLARVSLHLKLWALLLSTPGNGRFLSRGEFHWYLKQNHYIDVPGVEACMALQFSLSTMWVPGVELRSQDFTATTCWVISLPALIHTLIAILEFYEFHKVLFIFSYFCLLFILVKHWSPPQKNPLGFMWLATLAHFWKTSKEHWIFSSISRARGAVSISCV